MSCESLSVILATGAKNRNNITLDLMLQPISQPETAMTRGCMGFTSSSTSERAPWTHDKRQKSRPRLNLCGELLSRVSLLVAVLMDQYPVLKFCSSALVMFLDMMDFGLGPRHLRAAHAALLAIPPVDNLSIKRAERSLRILGRQIPNVGCPCAESRTDDGY